MLCKIKLAIRFVFVLLTLLLNYGYMHSSSWPYVWQLEGRFIKFWILVLMTIGWTLFVRFVIYNKKTYRKEDWLKSILTASFIAPWIPLIFFPFMMY